MWHYFNGDQDKDTDDDGDDSLDDDASSTEIRGCQSDSDEEAQRNPYPFGYRQKIFQCCNDSLRRTRAILLIKLNLRQLMENDNFVHIVFIKFDPNT